MINKNISFLSSKPKVIESLSITKNLHVKKSHRAFDIIYQ